LPLNHSLNAPANLGLAQFCASMWTPAQSRLIQSIARDIVPGIRTFAVPQGMQVKKGPDAVIEYVEGNLDEIINGDPGLGTAEVSE
jgi:hypothetical protein